MESRDKTLVCSKMADGSPERRTRPKQMNNLTFPAPDTEHGDSKKCSDEILQRDRVKLSFYTELETSESCEKSDLHGVAAKRTAASDSANSQISDATSQEGEERKKRCFDRYDSSESSDSGVAVLSSTESGCSGSDVTSPLSPRSPDSGCSAGDDVSAGARMPPWASEPAPRRLAAQPAPVRRPNPQLNRRITAYFNHKMKPQTTKREAASPANDDSKRKCLPKNGVNNDLEKYISYLSHTLSSKVMQDVSTQSDTSRKPTGPNGAIGSKPTDLSKKSCATFNGIVDYAKSKDNKDKNHTNLNGFMEVRHMNESFTKEKPLHGSLNGLVDLKKQFQDTKSILDPSANGIVKNNKQNLNLSCKVPISATKEPASLKIASSTTGNASLKKPMVAKPDSTRVNGVVSSTTKLDNRVNSVTCGSNNISLKIASKPAAKKETTKKAPTLTPKRTNRKSSACIANSKNLTWSKANNLKQQVQLQKQNCVNSTQPSSSIKTVPEASTAPKMTMPNGVRQVSMTVNGSIGNLNVPVNSLQNCHQLNISQPCNGTVTSTNLPSFVAVPQNVMLTTLRIPQNGIQSQTINQQNNLNAFNRANVNVSSPTKLNGQFVFPFMQNLNGTVVQIPNLMAKMPNFVLPQTPQLATQRQDHLQNQQAAQFLINGTLLKLANTMTTAYPNINKPVAATTQSIPVMNKNVSGIPTVGMTVQPKPNYAVNLSHSVLVPQPGFIVTSVPNINVKETWSYTTTNSASSQTSCANPIVHHPPPIVTNFSTQVLHTSSIPIAPVKPPDNPIQGTDPPSSTVKESDICETPTAKCDMPWLSKTVNNNIVPLDTKFPGRPFAHICSLSSKLEEVKEKVLNDVFEDKEKNNMEVEQDSLDENLRKVEEVARREDTIFTQITVLKDVSSNVQNTVIEANFCSATTESSESGIGTDKSIDSPSDSQASKECDEDSSLSLSVSVCEETVSSQKSPILKQPKTIRFPPRNPVKPASDQRTSSTDTTAPVVVCMWENCKSEFESDTDILEHLQVVHVESQAGKENYVCLWQGCKVRGKPSCSRLWLERHALSHGGNKPFKCIVDGCERRFSTQILLERHVNNHFTEASPNTSGSKKTSENGGVKLIRRNGKKLRYRRQPWSARMFDYFDAGTMEGLAWRLARCTRWRLGGACPLREPPGRHTLTLHAALKATRYNAQLARREALLTYYPQHVVEDEWVAESEVQKVRRVEMSSLPAGVKVALYEQFAATYRAPPTPPPAAPPPPPAAPRALPTRHCTSSRLLNKLLAKKKEATVVCSSPISPLRIDDTADRPKVSGAGKRKMGRKLGGKPFWPCGR